MHIIRFPNALDKYAILVSYPAYTRVIPGLYPVPIRLLKVEQGQAKGITHYLRSSQIPIAKPTDSSYAPGRNYEGNAKIVIAR